MNKVICIVGPTGVGKTKASLALAQHFNLAIINGDVMQMFKDVDILSAKVTANEQQNIKHYLIDFLDLADHYDVATFKKEATALIEHLNNQGIVPIVVGGSGLYLKALLYDYQFDDFKKRTPNSQLAHYSNEALYAYLKEIDPEQAALLHPNNRVRVERAVEIFEATQQSKTDLIAQQQHELVFDALVLGLEAERSALYQQIDQRVDQMIADGLLEEVKKVHTQYPDDDLQVAVAIGYKEMVRYLKKEISFEEAVAQIKQNSRRYAKKQLTWFKNQMDVDWINVDFNDFAQSLKIMNDKVEDFLNE
jgi:tRNA dimethylallyltransferase